ncbi:IS66 family transposase [Legionella oakridgensis]|uniref:Transposase IS66 family protein n=1 Tax=Legionella oakridgensis TaxID=29423 RepID=A0A0W0WY81_9GAMM|nr:IS66 family transposase [Legionella oakridgensis]KTD37258.1 Transposase IS66 family protein [Legionella oakridgensis]STY16210.1 Transposase and inactivated derivatives [Legionella longbeachae]
MDEKKSPIKLPSTIEDCHQRIKQLVEITEVLIVRVEKLELENRELKERLNNNSSNSSLPSSQDFKKKKQKKTKPNTNKGGGQRGHKGHFRKLLELNDIDDLVVCRLPPRCICGGNIQLKEDLVRHQVHELPKVNLHVTEYQLEKGVCRCCGTNQVAALPAGVTWGITGPYLTSFMSHLTSKYKLSRRELQEFLKEHYDFKISLGSVFNKQKLINNALEKLVAELLKEIKQSSCVHMDETGHRRDGTSQWLWGIMSATTAFFSIEKSRGKKVICALMGDFNNIVTSDRYAAYNYFESDKRQTCWAHLKRDFTKLSEKKEVVVARIGKELLIYQSKLFERWHNFKQGHISREELIRETGHIRTHVGELLEQGSYADPKLKIARFCKNLLENFTALWTFIFYEGVEPTNNHAERCLRPAVIWRKKYFGTRSNYGSEFVARTISLITTWKLQSKNAFETLSKIVEEHFNASSLQVITQGT